MPTGVTHVSETRKPHCFFVKGALAHLALGVVLGGAAVRAGGGWCGSGRGGGLVVEKVGQDRVDHDEL